MSIPVKTDDHSDWEVLRPVYGLTCPTGAEWLHIDDRWCPAPAGYVFLHVDIPLLWRKPRNRYAPMRVYHGMLLNAGIQVFVGGEWLTLTASWICDGGMHLMKWRQPMKTDA